MDQQLNKSGDEEQLQVKVFQRPKDPRNKSKTQIENQQIKFNLPKISRKNSAGQDNNNNDDNERSRFLNDGNTSVIINNGKLQSFKKQQQVIHSKSLSPKNHNFNFAITEKDIDSLKDLNSHQYINSNQSMRREQSPKSKNSIAYLVEQKQQKQKEQQDNLKKMEYMEYHYKKSKKILFDVGNDIEIPPLNTQSGYNKSSESSSNSRYHPKNWSASPQNSMQRIPSNKNIKQLLSQKTKQYQPLLMGIPELKDPNNSNINNSQNKSKIVQQNHYDHSISGVIIDSKVIVQLEKLISQFRQVLKDEDSEKNQSELKSLLMGQILDLLEDGDNVLQSLFSKIKPYIQTNIICRDQDIYKILQEIEKQLNLSIVRKNYNQQFKTYQDVAQIFKVHVKNFIETEKLKSCKMKHTIEVLEQDKQNMELTIQDLQNKLKEQSHEIIKVKNEEAKKYAEKNSQIAQERAKLLAEIRYNDERLKNIMQQYEKEKIQQVSHLEEVIKKYLGKISDLQNQVDDDDSKITSLQKTNKNIIEEIQNSIYIMKKQKLKSDKQHGKVMQLSSQLVKIQKIVGNTTEVLSPRPELNKLAKAINFNISEDFKLKSTQNKIDTIEKHIMTSYPQIYQQDSINQGSLLLKLITRNHPDKRKSM